MRFERSRDGGNEIFNLGGQFSKCARCGVGDARRGGSYITSQRPTYVFEINSARGSVKGCVEVVDMYGVVSWGGVAYVGCSSRPLRAGRRKGQWEAATWRLR